jgi:plastocyanin
MHRYRPGRLLALPLVVLLVACGNQAASPSVAESHAAASHSMAAPSSEPPASESAAADSEERVRIDGSQFDPAELTVAAGTTVVFLNADAFAHTITEGTDGTAVDDPIVDDDIEQNGSVQVTFDEAGTYEITCRIHPSMQMTITVEG